MSARPVRIAMTPGLPAPASPGAFIGRDENGALYLLRWIPDQGHFAALGWQAHQPKPWPHLVPLKDEAAGFIVAHVELPEAPR